MERKCIVNQHVAERNDLIRFVLGPAGSNGSGNGSIVVPDLKEKLPGRGVWVSCSKAHLSNAVENNLFPRAFKTRCNVPENFLEMVEALLETKCLNSLSLAKKAGQVITGFDKIFSAMSKRHLELLIEAKDGAEGGRRKLEQKFLTNFESGKVIKLFTSEQMDMAFGNTNVIHAAITHGNMTQNVLAATDKLAKFRG